MMLSRPVVTCHVLLCRRFMHKILGNGGPEFKPSLITEMCLLVMYKEYSPCFFFVFAL